MAATKARIKEITDEMFSRRTPEPTVEPVGNTDRLDLLQQGRNERFEMGKKQSPRGSSQKVQIDAAEAADRLRAAYRRARDDSELMRKKGDKQRAQMVIDQYMEDYFLPAVEAVIIMNNVDQVLNSKAALDTLDELVLLPAGSGSGYTRQYIMSLYDKFRGYDEGSSDMAVVHTLGKIHKLIEQDEIRAAIGAAKRLKDKIDNGENQANDEDYETLSIIVARGQ